MAYANALMFYGWSGDEATKLITKLTKQKMITSGRSYNDKTNTFIKSINDKLKNLNAGIQFNIFDGGIADNSETNFIPYAYFKRHEVESSGDDVFDEKSFTIKEMKEMFNQSFQFSKTFPNNPQPTMKILVNSDSK
jgi:hypothetical protein